MEIVYCLNSFGMANLLNRMLLSFNRGAKYADEKTQAEAY